MKVRVVISTGLLLTICQTLVAENVASKSNLRYERGLKTLNSFNENAGDKVLSSLNDVSPDLGRYIIEYSFGDIYSRPELDLKSKEVAVVAALTAMGNAQPQLKVHLHGALNAGCTVAEVQEIILQMSAYSGFPRAINGMIALKTVLQERRAAGTADKKGLQRSAPIPQGKSRYEVGAAILSMLNKNQVELLEQAFKDISPDMAKFVVEYGFADLYSRPALELKYRQIATIAALAAMGNAQEQLKFHIKAGLNIGLSQADIREIMLLLTVFAGFPAAINGTMVLKQVIDEAT